MDPFDAIGGQFSCIRGPLSRHQTRNLGYDSKQWMLFNNVAFSLNVLFQFDRMAFDYDCDCEAREVEVRTGHLVVGQSISNDDDDVVFAERTIDQQGERQRVPYNSIEGHDQLFRKEEMDVLVLDTGGWLDRDRSRSRTYDSAQRSR